MKKLILLLLTIPFFAKAQISPVVISWKGGNAVNYVTYTWTGKTAADTMWNAKMIRSYVATHGGGGSGINNSTSLQTGANFNIDGSGRVSRLLLHTDGTDTAKVGWHDGDDGAFLYLDKRGSDMHDIVIHLYDNAHLDRIREEVDINSADTGPNNKTFSTRNLDTAEFFSGKFIVHNEFQFNAFNPDVDSLSVIMHHANGFIADWYDTANGFNSNVSIGNGGGNLHSGDSVTRSDFYAASFGTQSVTTMQVFRNSDATSKQIQMSTPAGGYTPGIVIIDQIDSVGLVADGTVDTSKMTITPKMYVTSEWVLNHVGGGGSTLNFTNGLNQDGADVRLGGTLTDPTNIDISNEDLIITNDDTRFGISGTIALAAGAFETDHAATGFTNQPIFRADEVLVGFGINNTESGGALKSTSFGVDTVRGYYLLAGTRGLFQKGIRYSQLNFTNLVDSSLIPRKYAIAIMDSVKSTISGGGTTTHPLTLSYGILGTSFDGSSAITAKADSSVLQTTANFFPKADTRYYTKTASDARYEVPLTFTSGVSRTSNTVKADTTVLQTVLNFFPKGDTRYARTSALPVAGNPTGLLTYTVANGSSTAFKRADGLNAIDSTVVRSVANSYSLSGMATKLGNYFLKTDTTAFAGTLVHKTGTETVAGKKTFTLAPVFSSVTASLPLAVDASKNVITSPVTGTGSIIVMSVAPTITGTATMTAINMGGALSIASNNLGATTSLFNYINNQTAATSGTPVQVSGSYLWGGSARNTSTLASATVQFRAYDKPVSGNPVSGLWMLDGTIDGTTFINAMSVSTGGIINVPGLTASKVVFTDASKNLTSTGIGTSSQFIMGDGSLGTIGARPHTIFTPTTGGTVALTNNQYNIINPAGALLALTVNLPSSPANNDCVFIKFTQNVTTVTYAGGTVVDGITAPTAGGLTVLVYDNATTSWY